jgi:hypothetical protein
MPSLGAATNAGLYLTNTDTGYGLLGGVDVSGNGWLQVARTDATAAAYNLLLQPAGGNVGIGITGTPGYKLDVQGGQINTSGGLCIAGDCKTAWSQVTSNVNAANVGAGSFGSAVGGGNYSFPAKLTVTGGVYAAGIDLNRQSISSLQNNTTLMSGIYQNSGDGLYNAAGNAAALGGWWHVINMHHTDNNGFNAQIAVPLSASPNDIFLRTSSGGSWTEWRKVLSENSSGNVGIGRTDPGYRLHVYQDADVWHAGFGGASGMLRIGGQTGSGGVVQSVNPSNGAVRDLYLQRDGGNVGIGTASPGYKLHVNGNMYTTDGYSGGWWRNWGRQGLYNQDYGTHFYANGTDYWRVSSNSGLIIGSTTGFDSTPAGYIFHDGNGFGLLNSSGTV